MVVLDNGHALGRTHHGDMACKTVTLQNRATMYSPAIVSLDTANPDVSCLQAHRVAAAAAAGLVACHQLLLRGACLLTRHVNRGCITLLLQVPFPGGFARPLRRHLESMSRVAGMPGVIDVEVMGCKLCSQTDPQWPVQFANTCLTYQGLHLPPRVQ
jgi:hypothetical protein